jgi:hypothetical protein
MAVGGVGTNARPQFTSEIQLEINNRVGVLAAVASSIAGTETNIDQVQLEERDSSNSWLESSFKCATVTIWRRSSKPFAACPTCSACSALAGLLNIVPGVGRDPFPAFFREGL